MTISKKKKKKASIQKQNNIFELQGICWTQNLLQFFSILKGIFAEPQKFLKHRIYKTRKKQGAKQGSYSVKAHSENYTTRYMKYGKYKSVC